MDQSLTLSEEKAANDPAAGKEQQLTDNFYLFIDTEYAPMSDMNQSIPSKNSKYK